MTRETAAINARTRRKRRCWAASSAPRPYWDLAQLPARGQANPHPLAAILENGPARRHDPSPIWKPQPQETAYARNHHGPDVAANPVGRWLTDHRTATAVIRNADPAARGPHPSQRRRSHGQNRAAELSLTAPKRSPSSPHHAI